MEVVFDNDVVFVDIIKKDNRNIYFRISDDLKLIITCNKRTSDKELLKIINENKKSLTKMYMKAKMKINNSKVFRYLGNSYTIVDDISLKKVIIDDNLIFTPTRKNLDKFLKTETLITFDSRIKYWKEMMLFVPNFHLKVRKMKTRWGVCNKTKKIVTLNSELIRQDIKIIDYVIVHELCHFKEPNHSKNFWELVKTYYPDYKMARKILKEG